MMRNFSLTPTLRSSPYSLPLTLALAFATLLGAFTLAPRSSESIVLPIEVIGPDEYTERVAVDASNGSAATTLYLQAHSIGYPSYEQYTVNKASIRLNGGPWVDVTNEVATCLGPEGAHFECIDGPYPTIRFTIDLDDLGTAVDGTNTIDFRFNYAYASDSPDDFGDASIGYRILDLELRNGSADLIDGTSFTHDDPATWTAPDGHQTAQAVSDGEQLWKQRDLLTNVWGEGRALRAACADCHAEDGRDLQYFAYSNWAIIARSTFHGLSEDEGKKIAAFIRSRELQDVDDGHTYDPPGRPWHPVYQPGPTSVASRSANDPRDWGTPVHEMPSGGSQYWAAGAGLAWALDDEAETYNYLFPNGVTNESVSVDDALKMWHVPLALQFPDWNEWLPKHHPLDIWGDTFLNDRAGPRDNWPWSVYYGEGTDRDARNEFLTCWDNSGGNIDACFNSARSVLKMLYEDAKQWGNRKSSGAEPEYEDISESDDRSFRRATLMKWAAVKTWELTSTYDLADETHKNVANADVLQIPTRGGRNYFDIPPHLSGPWAGPNHSSGTWANWHNNAWYELNTTINHGKGFGTGISPNDWKYQHMFAGSYQWLPLRFIRSYAKLQENCESLDAGWTGTPRAWFTRPGHCDFGSTLVRRSWLIGALNDVRSTIGPKVFEALFRQQVEAMMYRHSPNLGANIDDEWDRRYHEKGWEPAEFKPSLSDPYYRSKETPSHYLKALDFLNSLSVKPTLLDSAAHWLDGMNPSSKWDDYKCTENGGPLDCSKPSLLDGEADGGSGGDPPSSVGTGLYYDGQWWGPGYVHPAGEPIDFVCSGSDVETMEWYANDTLIHSDTAPIEKSYTYTPSIGTHTIQCIAHNAHGTTDGNSFSYEVFDGTTGVTLSTPGDEATFTAPASFVIRAKAFDPDGIERIVFFSNDTELGSRSINFEYAWTHVPEGTYTLHAEALTNDGDTISSDTLSVTVTPGPSAGDAVTQYVELQTGWNFVSTYLAPEQSAIEDLLAPVADNIALVKDGQGAIYEPESGVDELEHWNPFQAYALYSETDQTLPITGVPLLPKQTPIPLEEGWNTVSFLPQQMISATEAMSSISDVILILKDDRGNAYIPEFNLNTIGNLRSGRGYQIFVSSDTELVYPEASATGTKSNTLTTK